LWGEPTAASDREAFPDLRESEAALFAVLDALAAAAVDARERKIVWPDGARLSIEDTARRVHSASGAPLDKVQSHVVGWLQMTYEPEGLDEEQMEEFERLIEQWTTPYDDAL
jgi:hypothetical protein